MAPAALFSGLFSGLLLLLLAPTAFAAAEAGGGARPTGEPMPTNLVRSTAPGDGDRPLMARGEGAGSGRPRRLTECPVGAYTIPDGTSSIGVAAFNGCSSLASVSLPEELT